MKKQLILLPVFALLSVSVHPTFLNTALEPYYQPYTIRPLKTGSTTISTTLSHIKATSGFDSDGNVKPLFEHTGASLFTGLMKGMVAKNTPLSTYYSQGTHKNEWKEVNKLTSEDVIGFTKTSGSSTTPSSYQSEAITVRATQHLFSGLFAHAVIRRRTRKLSLATEARGPNAAETQPALTALMKTESDERYNQFGMTSDATVKRTDSYSLHIGWGDSLQAPNNKVITEISGSLMGGYMLTPPTFENPLAPGIISDNISDGFIVSMQAHARIMKYISFNIHADATIFNQRTGASHIVRDDNTSISSGQAGLVALKDTWNAGPLLLGQGTVKKDPGTLWNLSATATLGRILGIAVSAGYQFTYQNKTVLSLRDNTILSNLKEFPHTQDLRLNSNPRLDDWQHHALVFGISIEPSFHRYRFVPRISAQCILPFMGKRCVKIGSAGDAWSVDAGMSLQWTF